MYKASMAFSSPGCPFHILVPPKGFHLKSRAGGCAANASQCELESAQGFAGLIRADEAKETMFNRVPFRGAGWIMADGDFQPQAVSQLLLNLLFP